ncbi:2-amino-4-hydroxy-6-hydroxymethyldihydropteridine diphosphokinase [bacterium]|nr:2-amino-4-hydroxy-6-hydroxymethyldihydropteridine diphosphokinase [bacterium]
MPNTHHNTFQTVIAVGSNLGDRAANVCQAIELVQEKLGEVVKLSNFYQTEPVGGSADQVFLNGAILIKTAVSPENQMTLLLEIEKSLGRERKIHWGNRTIDLDIVTIEHFVNNKHMPLSINTEHLTCPHPRLADRDFVLVPTSEVLPEGIDPRSKKSFKELSNSRNYSLNGKIIPLT